ncbi:hypothetical protein [Flavobacterium sp.]|uniref:hypothetical protein n=1 Tax=Flavobacterium sp. TaxID=239 RepID=UPI003BEECCA2
MINTNSYQPLPKLNLPVPTGVLWRCQGCHQMVQIESLGNGLDNGLELSGFSGYYGGFNDVMFDVVATNKFDDQDKAYLCHNCVVKLFTALPALAQSLGMTHGGHPSDSSQPPCCQWAWTTINDQLFYAKINSLGNLIWEPSYL